MPFHCSTLHRGSLFTVNDVTCHAAASGCGGEEHACADQLVLVRGGVFVQHIGRRRIVADGTRALFFNKGISYRVSHPADGGDRCTTIAGSADTWRELLGRHDRRAFDRTGVLLPASDRIIAPASVLRHQRMRRVLRDDPLDTLRAEETTLAVVNRILGDMIPTSPNETAARRAGTRAAQRELVENTKLVLAGRPAENRSLADLARDVCSSPFHLSRVFRREVGVPIHQYVLRLRLSLGLERLLDSTESLSEIALEVGFSSHSHFTTAFRQVFGVAPSAVRSLSTVSRAGWHLS